MLIAGGSGAVRSIPYLQNGSIVFDLYLENINSRFEVELESAYSDIYGKAAPIAFTYDRGAITFLGADAPCGLTLRQGWNRISIGLQLEDQNPHAVMTVNGANTANVPVNLEIGDYICYVDVQNVGTTNVYLDAFCVTDTTAVEIIRPHTTQKVEEVAPVVEENLCDDLELVAVIVAAIAAAEGTSTDAFVVRSIKRRPSNRW